MLLKAAFGKQNKTSMGLSLPDFLSKFKEKLQMKIVISFLIIGKTVYAGRTDGQVKRVWRQKLYLSYIITDALNLNLRASQQEGFLFLPQDEGLQLVGLILSVFPFLGACGSWDRL